MFKKWLIFQQFVYLKLAFPENTCTNSAISLYFAQNLFYVLAISSPPRVDRNLYRGG